jgi:hypothetical protein
LFFDSDLLYASFYSTVYRHLTNFCSMERMGGCGRAGERERETRVCMYKRALRILYVLYISPVSSSYSRCVHMVRTHRSLEVLFT